MAAYRLDQGFWPAAGAWCLLAGGGTSQELERGGAGGHRRSTRAASLVYGDTSLFWCRMKLHGGVWCTLVLGSRTSNPHLLLAQAQAQAAPGSQKTGNNPESQRRVLLKSQKPFQWEEPVEPHVLFQLHHESNTGQSQFRSWCSKKDEAKPPITLICPSSYLPHEP